MRGLGGVCASPSLTLSDGDFVNLTQVLKVELWHVSSDSCVFVNVLYVPQIYNQAPCTRRRSHWIGAGAGAKPPVTGLHEEATTLVILLGALTHVSQSFGCVMVRSSTCGNPLCLS
jgi:hypothetical protein